MIVYDLKDITTNQHGIHHIIMIDVKWLHEPKRFEIFNRKPKVDYKTLFKFEITVKV